MRTVDWQEAGILERVMRLAGKTRREVSNACISANETIALANVIARSDADLAAAQAEIARLRGALEEINRTTFDDDANRIAHSALK